MGAWLVGRGTVCFIEWLGGEGEFVFIDRSFFVGWWGVGVGEGRWERLRSSPRRSESRRKTRSEMV